MPENEKPTGEPELVDTGTYLEVPEAERLDEDDVLESEINHDAGQVDFADVEDGEVVDLLELAAQGVES